MQKVKQKSKQKMQKPKQMSERKRIMLKVIGWAMIAIYSLIIFAAIIFPWNLPLVLKLILDILLHPFTMLFGGAFMHDLYMIVFFGVANIILGFILGKTLIKEKYNRKLLIAYLISLVMIALPLVFSINIFEIDRRALRTATNMLTPPNILIGAVFVAIGVIIYLLIKLKKLSK